MTNHHRIHQLLELLKEDPGDAFLQYALGLELLKMSDLAKARIVFENLTTTQPDYLATYYQLGKLLEALREPAAAIKTYRDGIKIAEKQRNTHTLAELRGALLQLSDEAEE